MSHLPADAHRRLELDHADIAPHAIEELYEVVVGGKRFVPAGREAQQQTPFGMTVQEHLEAVLAWMDSRRTRLHHDGCSAHAPSARCNCGLHKALTDLRAAVNQLSGK